MKKHEQSPKTAEQRLEFALRQKFMVISFSVVFVVLFAITFIVNSLNYMQIRWKAEEIMEIIVENDGTFPQMGHTNSMPPEMGGNPNMEPRPSQKNTFFEEMAPPIDEETSYTTRFFTVKIKEDGSVFGVDTSKTQRVSPIEAEMFGKNALAGEHSLHMEEFYYCTVVPTDVEEYLVIFLDVRADLYIFQSFLLSSVMICLVSLLCVFVLLLCLSRKAVSPIVKTYGRQKEFITDMSHELKTPLAIVKANTEVLEMEHGDSPWTKSNHKQIEKLDHLIQTLLSLAKLEEEVMKGKPEECSLSLLVEEAGENLRVLVEQQRKSLSLKVKPQVKFSGDSVGLRQLLDILLDNALKYSLEGSEISLSLTQEKHHIQIRVENRCEGLTKGSYDQWFQRFYRAEGSRNSETGGFGLGLSMAKTWVKNHHGKITAFSPDGDRIVILTEFKSFSSSKRDYKE